MFNQDTMLHWHLEHNHYPPMGQYLDLAREALALGRLDGWDCIVEHNHPEIRADIRAAEVISGLHLEEFIMEEV